MTYMTSEKKALPFPSIPRLYKVVIFLSLTTAHLRSTRSFWCVFINQINDAFFSSSLFGIMSHFYQYYLCILKLGYLNGAGVSGLGGDISLFTFPHFHTMIVYFSGSGHTKRYAQTVACRRTDDHLVLSFFYFQQYDGTKSATERVVSTPLVAWRGTTPVWKGVVGKTQSETSPTPRIMSYQSGLEGSSGWWMPSGLTETSVCCFQRFVLPVPESSEVSFSKPAWRKHRLLWLWAEGCSR